MQQQQQQHHSQQMSNMHTHTQQQQHMHVNLVAGAAQNAEGAVGVPGGAQFTCFTSSKVQIPTQKALLGVAVLPIHVHPKFTTCFTSTKVPKLWLRYRYTALWCHIRTDLLY